MSGHTSPISGIAVHDNIVATAGYDNKVILWDRSTKTELRRGSHDHLANQATFSPCGRYLLTSSSDHTARLWSVPALKLLAVYADHADDVEMSAFHPSLPLVATASRDHEIKLYSLNGSLIGALRGHTADVISIAWNGVGDQLFSSSDDGTVKRWSLGNRKIIDEIDMAGVETDTVILSDDGTVFAGTDEGLIYQISNGNRSAIQAHAAGVKRLAYFASSKLLASLSYDRTMKIWQVCGDQLTLLRSATLPSIIWPRSCAFASEQSIVFGTFGSSYAEYRIDQDRWHLDGIHPTPGVNAVMVKDGRVLAIGDAGKLWIDGVEAANTGSLCNFLVEAAGRVLTGGQMGALFDAISGDMVYQFKSPLNCAASFLRHSVPHVVVGTYTGQGLIFAVSPDAITFIAEVTLHPNAVKSVAVSGDKLFSVSADCSVSWFDLDTFQKIAHLEKAHFKIANGCAALPDDRFASVSRDHKLRIWDVHSASVIDTPHERSIKCIAASADGRHLASGSYFGEVAIYDRVSATWHQKLRPTSAGISSIYFDKASSEFLASSYDGKIYRIAQPTGGHPRDAIA